ncbi:unnamed protein product [Psylliodes chrysocephalus]|uniref:Uncharacterized protein n=1 Tax=Psylliodes chrysocephalus TaxID=3402493 RepID=A0A9P0GBK9_9CUCU|nr:unnamed protein product [Psylliodes chrysocephala]
MDLKGKRLLRFDCEDCQSGFRLIPSLIAKTDKLETELKSLLDKPHGVAVSEASIIKDLNNRQKRTSSIMIYNLPENNNRHKSDTDEIKDIIKEVTTYIILRFFS